MSDSSEHRLIQSEKLSAPIGPYSPWVGFERLVFVSGQGAADPATGVLVGPGIEEQTEQVFENLEAILEASG